MCRHSVTLRTPVDAMRRPTAQQANSKQHEHVARSHTISGGQPQLSKRMAGPFRAERVVWPVAGVSPSCRSAWRVLSVRSGWCGRWRGSAPVVEAHGGPFRAERVVWRWRGSAPVVEAHGGSFPCGAGGVAGGGGQPQLSKRMAGPFRAERVVWPVAGVSPSCRSAWRVLSVRSGWCGRWRGSAPVVEAHGGSFPCGAGGVAGGGGQPQLSKRMAGPFRAERVVWPVAGVSPSCRSAWRVLSVRSGWCGRWRGSAPVVEAHAGSFPCGRCQSYSKSNRMPSLRRGRPLCGQSSRRRGQPMTEGVMSEISRTG